MVKLAKHIATVFMASSMRNDRMEEDYDIFIEKFQYRRAHIGQHTQPSSKTDGNSILLQLTKDNRVVFIGSYIFEFILDDEIVAYFSPLLGSNLSNPVVIGKRHIYFLADKRYISRKYVQIFTQSPEEIEKLVFDYCHPSGDMNITYENHAKPLKNMKILHVSNESSVYAQVMHTANEKLIK